ncbi:MAG: flagellar biosynthesis protein FliQ [Treponema sp.]
MSIGIVVNLMRNGIFQVFILAAPILLAALVVGLIVAIFQATTSIQEQTLTFVPKILTILGMLALLGGWMFSVLRDYTFRLFDMIPQIVQGTPLF